MYRTCKMFTNGLQVNFNEMETVINTFGTCFLKEVINASEDKNNIY